MATVSVSAGSQGTSGTTPVPSQLVAGDGVADAGFGQKGAHVAADVAPG